MSADRRPSFVHRLEHLAFRGIERLLSGARLTACVRLGRLAGRLFHALSPRYRRLVRRNLRIATANDPPPASELDALVLETFRRAGANFLGALRSPSLSREELEAIAINDGIGQLGERGPGKTGLVVAMPHMGNWEALPRLGRSYVGDAGVYGGIYRPLDNPLMDELTRQRRVADGARLFSRKDGFHPPAAMLRDGGVLGILSDQRAGGRGDPMPFFGKMTTCSPLPALLARRGRAEIATLTIASEPGGRWRIKARPLDGEPDTPAIMSALEMGMRESLPDVFWFHDRWRTDPARPLSFFTRIDPEVAARATVPLRLLVTLPAGLDPATTTAFFAKLFEARPDLRLDFLGSRTLEDHDPRVALHSWDPSQPDEHADATVRRIDESHAVPLDGALLFGSEAALAHAAKRLGLRAILGLEVSGKPWTRSFARPPDRRGWIEIAEALALVPKRHRR